MKIVQAGQSLRFDRLGHLPLVLRGRGVVARGKFEGINMVESHVADYVQRFLEIRVGFPRKTDDDVR